MTVDMFKDKFGPWALVAGGAQGIGETFSRHVAAQGVNVIAIDIDQDALDKIGHDLPKDYGVECLPLNVDLGADDMLDTVVAAVAEREVGLLIYNAAIASVGPFFRKDAGLDLEKARISVNVSGPLLLTYHFARPMLARRSGGIILMSSGAGLKGSPYYSAYSATKAYEITLCEALWYEFKPYNVDVLAVAAGMTLSTAAPAFQHLDTSEFQTTEDCVNEAMAALGQQPLIIAGTKHRAERAELAALPDQQAIAASADHAIGNFFGGVAPEQELD
ncbi:SDR family NAD(P)-dependent oxidoreductase [Ruegeria pomeroyi]|nr:SDR family NAD(P)-dependent oxidoreductase [Ruegeria pomeroyi]MCE8534638.1 SDR family NAD(P)-dependent oxidoreductase [Ruegeria pomeroyi]